MILRFHATKIGKMVSVIVAILTTEGRKVALCSLARVEEEVFFR